MTHIASRKSIQVTPMNRSYLIFTLVAVALIACGDSDDEQPSPHAKISIPSLTSPELSNDEATDAPNAEIDFAAEELAIRQLLAHHDRVITEQDLDGVMALWLKTDEVFMLPSFAGAVQIIETWHRIRDSWEATWLIFGEQRMRTTIQRVGIDTKAQNATAFGTRRYINPHAWDLIAALTKDETGEWKFLAIDSAEINQGLIKEIKTPQID
jgi:hypothetical protein